jgi:putative ABC transport system permease protein
MDGREIFRLSTRAIRGHKLRSALTVLGVVIGIAAVVTFVTLGASVKADVVGQIDQTAANNIYLLSEPDDGEGPPQSVGPVYTERDLERIRNIEGVQSVVPRGTVDADAVTYRNDTVALGFERGLTATTPATFDRATFVAGRGFESGEREVVVNKAARDVFEPNVSVNETITVTQRGGERQQVTVVGVVNRTGTASPFQSFSDQPQFYVPTDPFYDRVVRVPEEGENSTRQASVRQRGAELLPDGTDLTANGTLLLPNGTELFSNGTVRFPDGTALNATALNATAIADGNLEDTPLNESVLNESALNASTIAELGTLLAGDSSTVEDGQRAYPQVTVVADPSDVTGTRDRIEAYLTESDAAKLQPPGFEPAAQTTGDIADSLEELVNRLTRFVTGLALISLLVGAIGIANIMLVSVTERTREIGIMKAVGAQNRDVLVLFLTEATILGVVGAILALPVGIAGGWAATRYADIALTLAPEWFAVAVAVGVLVGVLAGLYPAWRAARVDPIDALRRE